MGELINSKGITFMNNKDIRKRDRITTCNYLFLFFYNSVDTPILKHSGRDDIKKKVENIEVSHIEYRR